MTDGKDCAADIAEVVGNVRQKGVRLWAESGRLRYRAPAGALSPLDLEQLKKFREGIVAFLHDAAENADVELLAPRGEVDRLPLTFSQRQHWHLRQLIQRPSVRQLASATRLLGRLNIEHLRRSLAMMVDRHEALRTQVIVQDGVPSQVVAKTGNWDLELIDLTAVPVAMQEGEVRSLIDQLILQPVNVASDPLFALRLLRLSADEHVLIVALEHMISDAVSLNILMRELFSGYVQIATGVCPSFAPIPVQFADYALWQTRTHDSWLRANGAYWQEHLSGAQSLRFPRDVHVPATHGLGWGTVPLCIDGPLKAELREWCRLHRTTVVMTVFTVYVAAVLRWCETSDAIIRYQTDGRFTPKVAHTMGYFASVLNLRVKLQPADSFLGLLSSVTQEYCNAHQRADFSFIDAQVPRMELTLNTTFNWVPQGAERDVSELDGFNELLRAQPVPFVSPLLKALEKGGEPWVLFYDGPDRIDGNLMFPRSQFSVGIMERFRRTFFVLLEQIIREPGALVKELPL